ncbi:MAG TPA: CPBP family intramembrane glutamic endopeptidase [Candidatus Sulfotelmatobacter sp.]
MAILLAHTFTAFIVLAAPWLGRVWYKKVRLRIASGELGVRIRLYRSLVVEQVLVAGVVLLLWRGGISASSLGLVTPRSWTVFLLVLLVIVGTLLWSALRLRPKAQKLRVRLKEGVGMFLPTTQEERSWWGAVSIGAGISEELAFRGFLLYYLAAFLPQLNTPERILVSSLLFGFAHLYQGWKGMIGTGILGAFFAGLYLLSGSLLLPAIFHAAVDYRVLLIFPPETSTSRAAEGPA